MDAELSAWESGGGYFNLAATGHRVFFRDFGAANAEPDDTALLMHGFPESSFSWHKVVEGLLGHFRRVVVFDLIGYGFSDKPGADAYGYSLMEQADVALQVWGQLGLRGGHLIAHDMGDSVSTELVARSVAALLPAWFDSGFRSVTFTNGSMVLELAKLRVTQRLLLTRIGPVLASLVVKKAFAQQVRSAQGSDALSDRDIELMWQINRQGDGHRKTYLTIRYLLDRRRFEATRWLPALGAASMPIHLCWGDADAVARVEMAHHLKRHVCPNAHLTVMPGVGHFCQLSDPQQWLDSVLAFYSAAG